MMFIVHVCGYDALEMGRVVEYSYLTFGCTIEMGTERPSPAEAIILQDKCFSARRFP